MGAKEKVVELENWSPGCSMKFQTGILFYFFFPVYVFYLQYTYSAVKERVLAGVGPAE